MAARHAAKSCLLNFNTLALFAAMTLASSSDPLICNVVAVLDRLVHGLLQTGLNVLWQTIPPAAVGDHHVVDHAVLRLHDGGLNFVELL